MPISPKKKSTSRRRSKHAPEQASPKLLGFIYLIVGTLLFCSAVTYTPEDLPLFGFLEEYSNYTQVTERQNLIGPIGVLAGWTLFILFGKANYFFILTFFIAGAMRIFKNERLSLPMILWGSLLLFSLCCLFEVFDVYGVTMRDIYHMPGPGGIVGFVFGELLFIKLFASVGATIILFTLAITSCIYLIGRTPVQAFKALAKATEHWWQNINNDEETATEESPLPQYEPLPPLQAQGSTILPQPADSAPQEECDPEPVKSAKPKRKRAKKKPTVDVEAEPLPQDTLAIPPHSTTPEETNSGEEIQKPKIVDSSNKAKTQLKREGKAFEKAEPTLATNACEGYELPGFDLIDYDENTTQEETNTDELYAIQDTIVSTLKSFNVDVTAGDITRGPTITRYEIKPAIGLRINKITQLEADLARATKAEQINILAPIPGKDTVGIEVANEGRVAVPFGEILQSDAFASKKNKIPLVLGKNVYGEPVIGDLAACPHMLVAGATGAGKSVCINAIIASML